MKVVAFASSKGGVGKSTLAFNTAIHAARSGVGVQLADRDPQRSLMDICLRRRDMPELVEDNPMLLENVATVSDAVSVLTESGYARDYLIVDTPGSFMDIISEAVGMADVIVVPLRASPFDLLAQEAVLSAIETLGKTDRIVFVVNMAEARSPLVKDALEAVRPMSPNKPLTIANRLDYARAAVSARAAVETNKDAAGEISALWDAIKRVARKDNGGKIHGQPSKPGKRRT